MPPVDIRFSPDLPQSGDALVLCVREGRDFTPAAARVDADLDGALRRAAHLPGFSGASGQLREILAPAGNKWNRVLLLGIGSSQTSLGWEEAGGILASSLGDSEGAEAVVCLGAEGGGAAAAHLARGLLLGSYRFDRYRTEKQSMPAVGLRAAHLVTDAAEAAAARFAALSEIAAGVALARDLVTEPPNVLYPESMAARIAAALEPVGVAVEILDRPALERLGMGALLGVGRGSSRDSRVVIMRWNGAGGSGGAPLAFIGKGVTFDTGGISLKPAANMWDMKYDMAGAAAVIGLMRALAGRRAQVDVVGLVGLVENMPDGDAQRPGDVVTSLSGKTIEVLNTDAEGRLVLADVLWYCQERFAPRLMIDLATLTGAITISLGKEHAGLFSNADALAARLTAAGLESGEKLWRMPLSDDYDKMLKSDIADMKNIGDKYAGSITAAQFLQRFVGKTDWAHLDIAGTAWFTASKPLYPKGATGFGVKLLDRFVAANFE